MWVSLMDTSLIWLLLLYNNDNAYLCLIVDIILVHVESRSTSQKHLDTVNSLTWKHVRPIESKSVVNAWWWQCPRADDGQRCSRAEGWKYDESERTPGCPSFIYTYILNFMAVYRRPLCSRNLIYGPGLVEVSRKSRDTCVRACMHACVSAFYLQYPSHPA